MIEVSPSKHKPQLIFKSSELIQVVIKKLQQEPQIDVS